MDYVIGIDGLEEQLTIPPGTVLALEGPPGSGKSFTAIYTVVKNIERRRSRALYISLAEDKEKIIERAESVGIPLTKYVRAGLVRIVQLPVLGGEDLVEYLTELITDKGPGAWADIVVVDNVTAVLKTLRQYDKQRTWLQTVLYRFTTREKGLLILISESGTPVTTEQNLLEYVADVVLELGMRSNPKCPLTVLDRYVLVKKHRFAPVTDSPYLIEIKGGVRTLGHVSPTLAKELRSRKRPLPINCTRLAEVIGKEIPPGTSILLINRRPGLVRTDHTLGLIRYLGTEATRSGMSIAVLTLSSTNFNEMMQSAGKQDQEEAMPLFVHLDPGRTHPKYFLNVEHSLALDIGIDIIFTGHLERLLDVAGVGCLTPYLNLRYSLLSNLGVTNITIYNLRNPSNYPYLLVMWSDIVIEIDIDEEGIYYEIREAPLPSTRIKKIHERDIKECIQNIRT